MLRADLREVKAEPNLGKRSMLALDNAFNALTQARDAYDKGENAQVLTFHQGNSGIRGSGGNVSP